MNFSTGRGLSSEINVTPMIDILLVLLIIFMAIAPVTPNGLEALLPRPPERGRPPAREDAVVLRILHTAGGRLIYKINQTEITRDKIGSQLATIFSTRGTKVLFIAGDKNIDFGPVARSIEVARGAGINQVGLITPRTAENR